MEYLQYGAIGFWIAISVAVLNLVINGIPSILTMGDIKYYLMPKSFKPCYKWNTFNTHQFHKERR